MNTCQSCGAPILWAVTVNGRRMPLDADPGPDGTMVLAADGVATVVADPALAWKQGAVLYTSHFATCPDADIHRRRERPML